MHTPICDELNIEFPVLMLCGRFRSTPQPGGQCANKAAARNTALAAVA